MQRAGQGRLHQTLLKSRQKEVKALEKMRRALGEEEHLQREEEECRAGAAGWPLWGGDYQPLQLIGKGGTSEVYKCFSLKSMNY